MVRADGRAVGQGAVTFTTVQGRGWLTALDFPLHTVKGKNIHSFLFCIRRQSMKRKKRSGSIELFSAPVPTPTRNYGSLYNNKLIGNRYYTFSVSTSFDMFSSPPSLQSINISAYFHIQFLDCCWASEARRMEKFLLFIAPPTLVQRVRTAKRPK